MLLLSEGALGNHFEICSYRLSFRPSQKVRRPATWEHKGGKNKTKKKKRVQTSQAFVEWLLPHIRVAHNQLLNHKHFCKAWCFSSPSFASPDVSNGGWQKGEGKMRRKERSSWIRRAPCFAYIFEWTRCLCRADALSDNNLLSCPFAWIFKQARTLMCTRLRPCIVNQLDSSASLMTHLSLSLTRKDLLTITCCGPASLLPYWLPYNTL